MGDLAPDLGFFDLDLFVITNLIGATTCICGLRAELPVGRACRPRRSCPRWSRSHSPISDPSAHGRMMPLHRWVSTAGADDRWTTDRAVLPVRLAFLNGSPGRRRLVAALRSRPITF